MVNIQSEDMLHAQPEADPQPPKYEWAEGDVVRVSGGFYKGRRGMVTRVYSHEDQLAVLVAGYMRTIRMGTEEVRLELGHAERVSRD